MLDLHVDGGEGHADGRPDGPVASSSTGAWVEKATTAQSGEQPPTEAQAACAARAVQAAGAQVARASEGSEAEGRSAAAVAERSPAGGGDDGGGGSAGHVSVEESTGLIGEPLAVGEVIEVEVCSQPARGTCMHPWMPP